MFQEYIRGQKYEFQLYRRHRGWARNMVLAVLNYRSWSHVSRLRACFTTSDAYKTGIIQNLVCCGLRLGAHLADTSVKKIWASQYL